MGSLAAGNKKEKSFFIPFFFFLQTVPVTRLYKATSKWIKKKKKRQGNEPKGTHASLIMLLFRM